MDQVQRREHDRRLMIESFSCLAHHLVKRYRHWSLDQADVFQMAMIAVIQAVDDFDPARKVPLGAYVTNKVKWKLGIELERARKDSHATRTYPFDVVDPDSVRAGDDNDDLWDAIERLPKRDQAILISCFGLDGQAPRRKAHLATELGCTGPTVGNSTRRSIKTMRAQLSA